MRLHLWTKRQYINIYILLCSMFFSPLLSWLQLPKTPRSAQSLQALTLWGGTRRHSWEQEPRRNNARFHVSLPNTRKVPTLVSRQKKNHHGELESRQVGNTAPSIDWAFNLRDLNKIKLFPLFILFKFISEKENIVFLFFIETRRFSHLNKNVIAKTHTDLWSPTEYSFFTVDKTDLFYYSAII